MISYLELFHANDRKTIAAKLFGIAEWKMLISHKTSVTMQNVMGIMNRIRQWRGGLSCWLIVVYDFPICGCRAEESYC